CFNIRLAGCWQKKITFLSRSICRFTAIRHCAAISWIILILKQALPLIAKWKTFYGCTESKTSLPGFAEKLSASCQGTKGAIIKKTPGGSMKMNFLDQEAIDTLMAIGRIIAISKPLTIPFLVNSL